LEIINKFYVYSHIDNKGKCFYIGKGSGRRAYHSKGRTEYWGEKAKNGYKVLILVSNLTEEKAYELEWKFGEQIGWENLVNQRIELGCGVSAATYKQETRDKISKVHKGLKKPFSKEHRLNHKKAYSDRKVTWGKNISKGLKGRKVTWDMNPNKNYKATKVAQYSMDWEYIKTWDSVSEAKKFINGDISGFINGRGYKHAGGFKWKKV